MFRDIYWAGRVNCQRPKPTSAQKKRKREAAPPVNSLQKLSQACPEPRRNLQVRTSALVTKEQETLRLTVFRVNKAAKVQMPPFESSSSMKLRTNLRMSAVEITRSLNRG